MRNEYEIISDCQSKAISVCRNAMKNTEKRRKSENLLARVRAAEKEEEKETVTWSSVFILANMHERY